MKPRPFAFALLGLTLAASFFLWPIGLPAAETPKTPTPATTQRVVKLLETRSNIGAVMSRGPGAGRTPDTSQTVTAYLIVTPPDGGAPAKLLISDDLRRKISSLFPLRGELITITVKPGSLGGEIVTDAVAFDGPKSLQHPKVFIFDGVGQQKIGVQTFTTAKLSKFGQLREVLVPNRPSFNGAKPQADATLLERLHAFAAGDAVEIDVAPGPVKNTFMLLDIDTPRDPLIGEFVKLTSLKDAGNKTVPGIVINVDGHEQSYAFPAPSAGVPPNGALPLAKTLKVGHSVSFHVRQAEGHLATLRDLKIDGLIEPMNEESYHLVSTYVRIDFRENATSRETWINYRPGSNRPEDQILDRGVSRVLESDSEIARLKLSADQVKRLVALQDNRNDRRNAEATPQEKSQWAGAFKNWLNARDETARAAIEQEMLRVAQDLSMRWRDDFQSKYNFMRSVLTAEQLEEIRKVGEPKYRMAPAA
jgi:molecular chaperone GrpE (heat shock protein)